MRINGREANMLLFILDKALGTDSRGKINRDAHTYGLGHAAAQDLRDRLLGAHEHPEGED